MGIANNGIKHLCEKSDNMEEAGFMIYTGARHQGTSCEVVHVFYSYWLETLVE